MATSMIMWGSRLISPDQQNCEKKIFMITWVPEGQKSDVFMTFLLKRKICCIRTLFSLSMTWRLLKTLNTWRNFSGSCYIWCAALRKTGCWITNHEAQTVTHMAGWMDEFTVQGEGLAREELKTIWTDTKKKKKTVWHVQMSFCTDFEKHYKGRTARAI